MDADTQQEQPAAHATDLVAQPMQWIAHVYWKYEHEEQAVAYAI